MDGDRLAEAVDSHWRGAKRTDLFLRQDLVPTCFKAALISPGSP